jgi:hypothetical protein
VKRTPLTRRPMRRKARKSDVPDWLFGYLLARDRGECVPHKRLGAPGECFGRLTIEHVHARGESATGMRAKSDKWHTLIACLGANGGWCLTSAAKELEREYLSRIEGAQDDAA